MPLSRISKVIVFASLSLSGLLAIAHEVADRSLERRDAVTLQTFINGQIRQQRPVMVNEWLRLDRVQAGERGREIIFTITMLNVNALDVSREQWIRQVGGVLAAARGDAKLRPLAEKGLTLTYAYVGRDGFPIGRVHIRPQDVL